jgi:ubiquinone/menaquinone biosynthesis C-methylase UbiE
MSWLDLSRVPEPEVMDEAGEVEAYSSAAAQTYLSKIDDTLVTHVQRLVAGRISAGRLGIALDIGTGPGQIVRKLAAHLPGWLILGVDRSPNMVREAITARNADGNRAARVDFMVADANCLPFAGASFDLVLCNSVLHHFMDPARVLAEIARVAKPDGAVLVRDIVRPSRAAFPFHSRWGGRHYSGTMYRLYCDSLRAAYTFRELSAMLVQSPLHAARPFRHGRTHIGIEREVA